MIVWCLGLTYAARGHLARYMEYEACGTNKVTTADSNAVFEFSECHGKTCKLNYRCKNDSQYWLFYSQFSRIII